MPVLLATVFQICLMVAAIIAVTFLYYLMIRLALTLYRKDRKTMLVGAFLEEELLKKKAEEQKSHSKQRVPKSRQKSAESRVQIEEQEKKVRRTPVGQPEDNHLLSDCVAESVKKSSEAEQPKKELNEEEASHWPDSDSVAPVEVPHKRLESDEGEGGENVSSGKEEAGSTGSPFWVENLLKLVEEPERKDEFSPSKYHPKHPSHNRTVDHINPDASVRAPGERSDPVIVDVPNSIGSYDDLLLKEAEQGNTKMHSPDDEAEAETESPEDEENDENEKNDEDENGEDEDEDGEDGEIDEENEEFEKEDANDWEYLSPGKEKETSSRK